MLRNIKMISLLLDYGAEIDAKAFNNDTPTDMASNNYFYDVVSFLMERGAVCHAHFMGWKFEFSRSFSVRLKITNSRERNSELQLLEIIILVLGF